MKTQNTHTTETSHEAHTHTTHTRVYITPAQYVALHLADFLAIKSDMVTRNAKRVRAKLTPTQCLWDYYYYYNKQAVRDTRDALLKTAEMLQNGIDPNTGIQTGQNLLYIKINK